jgi:two-component system NtrC family sensor kinase
MTAALKENHRKLVEADKLAGIGRLAAGFAHEINNPLTVVLGYIMRHRRGATGQMAKDLEVAEQEVQRCREIVQELLEIARPSLEVSSEPVDLREVCEDVVGTLRGSGVLATSAVSIEGAGEAVGSRDKLRQVLVNLVKNAGEACGPQGTIRVRVVAGPPWALVEVADDGPGVDGAARERLFEPFFTTKPSGTGLGLAVSRSIARAHGGDIEVPEVDVGALFRVRLRQASTGGKHA